jgi:hypothetical protein
MQRQYAYRRNLPHRQWSNKIFFITFSTLKRQVFNGGIARSRLGDMPPGKRQAVPTSCSLGATGVLAR